MKRTKNNFLKLILVTLCVSVVTSFKSQKADSLFLTETDFILSIKNFHPVLKSFQLIEKSAKAMQMGEKGSLDPSIASDYAQKSFDGKNYYSVWQSQLKVPTWFGPDFKLGYDNNFGEYVNGENLTPTSGLVALGVSVPIAQGMLIDERRNAIKQAKLFVKMARAEQVKQINKLLFSALKDYWTWYEHYNKLKAITEGYSLAKDRYGFIKERVNFGDAAPIDSVEASIQMQSMRLLFNNASIDFYNATQLINTYLWKDDVTPVELSDNTFPQKINASDVKLTTDSLQKWLQWAQNNNPELIKQQLKIDQTKVELFFAKNKLLPGIKADYSLLYSGNQFMQSVSPNFNNTKIGASVYYPLLLRKDRAKLTLTKIKLMEADYFLQQTQREVNAFIKSGINEVTTNLTQIEIQNNVVSNSVKLRNAEKINFDNGESSMFLINSRENSLLNNRIKLFEIISKFQKAKANLYNNIGNLGSIYGINTN